MSRSAHGKGRRRQTSAEIVDSASQSSRGSKLARSFAFVGRSSETSSASLGCSGKEAEEDLQALTAQVRKLRVRTFIVAGARWWGEGWVGWDLGSFFLTDGSVGLGDKIWDGT